MVPPYVQGWEKIWHYALRVIVGLILFYLIFPIIVIIPLSFNAEAYFTFTKKMLSFDLDGYSLKWYNDFFSSLNWQQAVKNSIIIAIFSTLLSTFFGTLAALGLSRSYLPFRSVLMAILISPMIVPLIISAAAMFLFIPSGAYKALMRGLSWRTPPWERLLSLLPSPQPWWALTIHWCGPPTVWGRHRQPLFSVLLCL